MSMILSDPLYVNEIIFILCQDNVKNKLYEKR